MAPYADIEVRRAKARDYQAKYRGQDPARYRATQIKSRYGCSSEWYDAQRLEQEDLCYLCGEPETTKSSWGDGPRLLCVDHDHETNAVRKLICHRCNMALGMSGDDPALLRKMADYIEDHR